MFKKNFIINILILLSLLIAIGIICFIQFSSPYFLGCPDQYFHVRMANIIREEGFPAKLHWAHYTPLSKSYSGRDFLFHLFILPFTYLSKDFFLGGKIAACVFGASLILTLAWVGNSFCRKGWLPFLILGLLFSGNYLMMLVVLRPYIFSVIFGLLGIYAIVKRRFLGLFAISFLYSLFHMSSLLLFIWVLFNEVLRKVNREDASIKPVVVVSLGIVLALFFYPNFLANFYDIYVQGYSQVVNVLFASFSQYRGIRFPAGGELNPMNTRALLFNYPLLGLSIILVIISLTFRKPKFSTKNQLLSLVALLFIILSLFSARYAVQAYPYITLFVFAFVSEMEEHFSLGKKFMEKKFLFLVFIPLIAILSMLGINIFNEVKWSVISNREERHYYIEAAKWMSENLEKGVLIYNEVWSDGTFLVGLNPNNDYLDFLASEYMYKYDPELYRLRQETNEGKNCYYNLKYIFKAKYGFGYLCSGLGQTIQREPGFRILYRNGPVIVFEVR